MDHLIKLFLFTFFGLVVCKNDIYMGHKIYNIKFKSQLQQDSLNTLKGDIIDFLKIPSFKNNVIGKALVPPSQMDWFEERLQDIGVDIDVHVQDVFEYLKEKEKSSILFDTSTRNFGYNGYYRYDEIVTYLNALANTTDSIEVIEYGRTDQDRPLIYVKIASNPEVVKPIIVVEAGMIPREWITIPTAVNVIERVISTEQVALLNNLDWIIIPVVNPDGYEYSHTDLRLWSKSVSTTSNLGFICPGVNINRNFDIDWLTSDSSTSPCSHIYAGQEPFSEIESQFLRDIIEEHKDRTAIYISLQNNGGFITYPWQYEKAASGMYRQHHWLGMDMIETLNGTYNLGIGSLTLDDRASGTSSDYAQRSGILYSFNVNVEQDANDGVLIPESEIPNVVDNIWGAIAIAASNFI